MSAMKLFKVAETKVNIRSVSAFLKEIGAEEWDKQYPFNQTNGPEAVHIDDHSYLTEIMGRLCYKSFGVGLNPNITATRDGNRQYVGNLLKQMHGSVLEHSYVTYVMLNVSRIFTHELVRHRAGMAFSQESQRFVRLTDFEVYIPELTPVFEELFDIQGDIALLGRNKEEWVQQAQANYLLAIEKVQGAATESLGYLSEDWGLDLSKVPFGIKKKLTSALRRMVPGGVLTNIGVTGNHRAWRHILGARTSPGAELEAIEGCNLIGNDLLKFFPNIYQDCTLVPHVDYPHLKQFVFANPKV